MDVRDAGLLLLQSLRQNPQTLTLSVIICSADLPYLDEHREQVALLGAEAIPKPFEIEHLLETVKRLLAATPE